MGRHHSKSIGAALALAASIVLSGCGGESPEQMLASAKDFLAKGDNKAAVIQLKNVLQGEPNQGEARFLLGKTLLASGDVAAAEIELLKARDLKYSADQVTPVLARTQLMLGESNKVIDELARSELSTAESRADLQTTVGQAYLMTGKIDAAQAAFAAALDAVPGYAPALIGEARIKAGRRDLAGALKLLETVLEKSPKAFEAWHLKGEILSAQGDPAASSAAYRQALEIKPDLLATHSALVGQLIESGDVDSASKQLEAMKKIAPTHPLTSYRQAELYYRLKNYKAAQETIQNYLKVAADDTKGLLLAGAIEYELRAYTLAESYLLRALPKTPELGLARRLLTALYLRNGQPDKALGVLQPVLDKIEGNSNMLALAGEVYMQNGDAERANKYFTKAAALDPTNTAKRTSVALSQLAQGDSESAYRQLEEIAAQDSGTAADMALVAALLRRRQFDPALKAIAAFQKKQPDNPLVDNLRGSALLGKGDLAGARRSFEAAQAKNPLYFPAAGSLASIDLLEKKPEDARKRFDAIIAKDPKNMPALLALAQLRARTGASSEEVTQLIRQAITANPTEPAPRIALIEAYLSSKDAKNALSAAQEAIGALPDKPEVLDAAGRAQIAAADYNQALATYAKMAAQQPGSPIPQMRMADAQMAAKDKVAAMRSLRKALSIKPDHVDAQRGIIALELDAGRHAEALAVARQVQSQRPREPLGYLFEGDVYSARKSWNEAAAAYRNGLKQSGAPELSIKLYASLLAAGKGAEAEKFADGYLKEHPKELPLRLYLAESATAKKDYATATRYYRMLVDAQPNNAALLNNLAWSSAQLKDPKAIEYAEKANQLAPDQPAILDTLGELLLAQGDTARALELSKKAASLAPQNPQIKLNLAKALVKTGDKTAARKELDELVKLGDKFAAQAEVGKMLQSL